jgi:hypothetical protein
MTVTAVISSCYFPSVSWFQDVLQFRHILLDLHEHYYKQTNRNRCTIITANGLMPLIIPVNTNGNHTPVKDVRIDYSYPWQRVHHNAIVSAYAHAPYFDHYRDSLHQLFAAQPVHLHEWNSDCMNFVTRALRVKLPITNSEAFVDVHDGITDLRSSRKKDLSTVVRDFKRYSQVFEERHGFHANLSILDLLFCCGPLRADLLK